MTSSFLDGGIKEVNADLKIFEKKRHQNSSRSFKVMEVGSFFCSTNIYLMFQNLDNIVLRTSPIRP